MNHKNILEIARALIDVRAKFKMTTGKYDRDCGAAGCIAGHIAYFNPHKRMGVDRENAHGSADENAIRSHFRISADEACALFVGGNRDFTKISRWDAAAALARFATDRTINFKRTTKPKAIAMVETAEKEFL